MARESPRSNRAHGDRVLPCPSPVLLLRDSAHGNRHSSPPLYEGTLQGRRKCKTGNGWEKTVSLYGHEVTLDRGRLGALERSHLSFRLCGMGPYTLCSRLASGAPGFLPKWRTMCLPVVSAFTDSRFVDKLASGSLPRRAISLPPTRLFGLENARCFSDYSGCKSLCENVAGDATSAEDKNGEQSKDPVNQKMIIGFTCKQCERRSHHLMSKQAYTKGVVLIECPGCSSRHLIADNLHWFPPDRVPPDDGTTPQIVNVESMAAAEGVPIKTAISEDERDKEAVEHLLDRLRTSP